MKRSKSSRKKGPPKQTEEPFIHPEKLTPEEMEDLRANMREALKRLQELDERDQASQKKGGKDAE